MKEYLKNFTIALNRFLNALTGGRYDEEISLRTAIAERKGKKWACYFCKFLHWVDHNHCEKTFNGEETGADAGLRFLVLLVLLALVLYFAPLLILG